jgi:hypothetical protein
VGLVRKRLLTIEEIVCHTTKPIKSSLLQLQSSDPNHVRMACEVFKHIMFYMGDRRPTTSRLNETTCVRTILHRGLAYKELRDEVFCQLCKQLTQNPSRDSKYKGWDLMAYCICTFPPTPRFSKYLAIFLQEAMCADSVKTSQRAVFCIEKLHRRLVNGERKMIPSDQGK